MCGRADNWNRRGGWSWGRGPHARPVVGTVSTAGLRHNLIGRRKEGMGRREGFWSRGFLLMRRWEMNSNEQFRAIYREGKEGEEPR